MSATTHPRDSTCIESGYAQRASEAVLRRLVEELDMVVFVVDVGPGREFRYAGQNAAGERMSGLRDADLRGRRPVDLVPRIPAEQVAEIERRYRKCLERGSEISFRQDLVIDGVSTRWRLRLVPLADPAGDCVKILGLGDEISQELVARKEGLRHAEEHRKLQQLSEALERSNQELEQFAYVASHDLQEPLRKIRAFGDRLRRYGEGFDEEGRMMLGWVVDAAGRMQQLIDDLLLHSRITTHAEAFAEVDLSDVAARVLSDLELRIRDAEAEVIVGDLPVVWGDRSQLAQLLQNLVSNALKFRHPERPQRIEIRAEVDGDGTVLQVKDRGIGFDPRHAQRIFEIFQRLHSRSEYPGTGIGLALCQKIALRHGGRITADATPGEGAAFSVVLPARRRDGRDAP